MILYKYTSYEIGLKILLEKKLRYTQPICFNDPFELYPYLEGFFSFEQLEEMLSEVIQPKYLEQIYHNHAKRMYDGLNECQKLILSYENFYAFFRSGIQQEFDSRNIPIKDIIRNYIYSEESNLSLFLNQEYLTLINSAMGILCLSKKNDNLLMWSHYSDSHAGIILKINVDNPFFEYLEKVNYPPSNERPKIKLSKNNYTSEESINIYKNIFYSKSSHWSYEEEYRDYKALVKGYNSNIFDKSGIPIILFEYPIEIIEGVIFGARVDNNKVFDFIDKVEKEFKNLHFERALLERDKFALCIMKI